jgi:hypothetical protein
MCALGRFLLVTKTLKKLELIMYSVKAVPLFKMSPLLTGRANHWTEETVALGKALGKS